MGTMTIVIITTAVVVFVLLALIIRLLTRRAEGRQQERIRRRSPVAPIETSSPIDDPLKEAKKTALESIRFRYTIIRHVFIVLLLLVFLLAMAFPLLGTLPAAVLSGFVAIVGVIIGIAARPVIENFVAGVIITLSGSIHVADTVIIDDKYGTIEDITPTHTVIKLWDWRRYVMPNSIALSRDFLNLTLHDSYQWAKVDFWVSPQADLKVVEREAIAAACDSKTFADHEPPHFWVIEMGKQAIRCWVTAWANNPSDAWQLKHDIRRRLAGKLKDCGVEPNLFNLKMEEPKEDAPRSPLGN